MISLKAPAMMLATNRGEVMSCLFIRKHPESLNINANLESATPQYVA